MINPTGTDDKGTLGQDGEALLAQLTRQIVAHPPRERDVTTMELLRVAECYAILRSAAALRRGDVVSPDDFATWTSQSHAALVRDVKCLTSEGAHDDR